MSIAFNRINTSIMFCIILGVGNVCLLMLKEDHLLQPLLRNWIMEKTERVAYAFYLLDIVSFATTSIVLESSKLL